MSCSSLLRASCRPSIFAHRRDWRSSRSINGSESFCLSTSRLRSVLWFRSVSYQRSLSLRRMRFRSSLPVGSRYAEARSSFGCALSLRQSAARSHEGSVLGWRWARYLVSISVASNAESDFNWQADKRSLLHRKHPDQLLLFSQDELQQLAVLCTKEPSVSHR